MGTLHTIILEVTKLLWKATYISRYTLNRRV